MIAIPENWKNQWFVRTIGGVVVLLVLGFLGLLSWGGLTLISQGEALAEVATSVTNLEKAYDGIINQGEALAEVTAHVTNFARAYEDINKIETNVSTLQVDVGVIKFQMESLTQNVSELTRNVDELKENTFSINTRLDRLIAGSIEK